jgi:REP element-mobilizing transposase RayT
MDFDNVRHVELPYRKMIRLKEYDYTCTGLYFITICVNNRLRLFGEIGYNEYGNSAMVLNKAGNMILKVWEQIPIYYSGIDISAFQIMPNHIHGIISIVGSTKERTLGILSLPDIVQRFKTLTMKRYIDGVKQDGWERFDKKLWQRNYYEHIIRDEQDYQSIYQYISNNPVKWQDDAYYNN